MEREGQAEPAFHQSTNAAEARPSVCLYCEIGVAVFGCRKWAPVVDASLAIRHIAIRATFYRFHHLCCTAQRERGICDEWEQEHDDVWNVHVDRSDILLVRVYWLQGQDTIKEVITLLGELQPSANPAS
jgi:hypothetical protein